MKNEQPLAEVFGFAANDFSKDAIRYRKLRLCPFNNRVPSCTKDKANNPLGVCSIFDKKSSDIVITCPIRFRENWLIAEDAANYFFDKNDNWTSLSEIRLNDKFGETAGNIDMILVSYNSNGIITNFGALEVQAVYITGNIRRIFESYIDDPRKNIKLDWSKKVNYPKADFLSSSRKRLLPQLIYKGSILNKWQKRMAVALNKPFYDTLPKLPEVSKNESEIAWLIYNVEIDKDDNKYKLRKDKTVYTKFSPALKQISTPKPGKVTEFINILQEKLDEKLESNPPVAPTIIESLEE